MRPAASLRTFLFASLCCVAASAAVAGPQDGVWRSLSPPPRESGGRVVYDPVHGRLLLFGGAPLRRGEVYELPLSGPRVWRRLAVQGSPPPARQSFSLIDDPVRDRLILFGGYGDGTGSLNQVWELSLSETPTWSQLTPSGPDPGWRTDHAAIFDPVRDRMLICCGSNNLGPAGDVWALSFSGPPTWQLVMPAEAVITRINPTAVYDAVGDQMLVFGGDGGGDEKYFNDVRALSLSDPPTWTLLTPTPGPVPGPRSRHAAAWDPTRRQMLIVGGDVWNGTQTRLADAWRLSLSPSVTWTALPSLAAGVTQDQRTGLFAAYDPTLDGFIAGDGAGPTSYLASDLELSLASPTAWSEQPFAPGGGDAPAMTIDAPHGRALVFEGSGAWAVSLNDDEPTWSPILTGGIEPPLRRAVFHDPLRNRMVLVAETGVWALDLSNPTAWTTLATTGASPLWPSTAVVYDPVRDRALFYDGSPAHNLWQLALSGTPTWTPVTVAGTPPSNRAGPALFYDPEHDRLIVFGGESEHDLWAIPLATTPTWTPIATTGTPATLGDGTCVFDDFRHRLIVFGTGNGAVKSLSLDTQQWSTLSPQGSGGPLPTTYHMSAVFDASHDRIVTYGGMAAPPSPFSGSAVAQPQSFELAFSGTLDAPHPGPVTGRLAFSRIAPDPASGEQRFEWSRPADAGARLGIFDLAGKCMWSRTLAAGDTHAVWDGRAVGGRAVAPGVYFAEIRSTGDVARGRIVRLL